MKIFRVITEHDGKTAKSDGGTSTEIIRTELRFAARQMSHVWEAMQKRIIPADETIIAIIEEQPAIIILEESEN